MNILGLDTSTLMSTCVVMREDKILGEFSFNVDMSHSERLIPMIKHMMEEINMDISEIDLYGVSTGPGSFTGLRIGVATVKALAHVFNKPIVGVPTLKALAYNMPYNKVIVPMLDARRDRIYTGVYDFSEEIIRTLKPADVVYIKDLPDYLKDYEEVLLLGNGTRVYSEELRKALGSKLKFANVANNDCRASSVAELAYREYLDGNIDSYYTLVPDYLRVSQAEREKAERENAL